MTILPSISIVTPNYNHANFVAQAMDSVISQTRQPQEYLVIDDGSFDNSQKIITQHARRDFIKTIFHKKNKGIILTLNEGLEKARGDYVLFLSADDFLDSKILHLYLNHLQHHPSVGFLCSLTYKLKDNDDPVLCSPQRDFPVGYIEPDEAKKLIYNHGPWFYGNTVLLNRKLALENGGFKPSLLSYTDGFLYMTLALKYGLIYLPQPLATYRRQETSFSTDTYRNLVKLKTIETAAIKLMKRDKAYDPLFAKRWKDRWDYLKYNAHILHTKNHWPSVFKFLAAIAGFLVYRWYDVLNVRLMDVFSFIKACNRNK